MKDEDEPPSRNPYAGRDAGPDETPRCDFTVWIREEGRPRSEGFPARAYWRFYKLMQPRLVFRLRLGSRTYRITLRPTTSESHPAHGILERALAREAAEQAKDFGQPKLIDDDE